MTKKEIESIRFSDFEKEMQLLGEPPWERIEEEEFEEIKANIENLPKRPAFPFFILMIALLKDFIDFMSFGIFGILFNVLAWIALRLWLIRKMGFIKRWLYKRFIFALILEFVPFINMIPMWTIFVLRGHAKENERVDRVLRAVENLLFKIERMP